MVKNEETYFITDKIVEMDQLLIYNHIKDLSEASCRIFNDADKQNTNVVSLSFYSLTEKKTLRFTATWVVDRGFYNAHLRDELFLNDKISPKIREKKEHYNGKTIKHSSLIENYAEPAQ